MKVAIVIAYTVIALLLSFVLSYFITTYAGDFFIPLIFDRPAIYFGDSLTFYFMAAFALWPVTTGVLLERRDLFQKSKKKRRG